MMHGGAQAQAQTDRFISSLGVVDDVLNRIVSHSYLGSRTGLQFDVNKSGRTRVTGYGPASGARPANLLDIPGDYRSAVNSPQGIFGIILGTDFGLKLPYETGIRGEFEFAYQGYNNRVCHRRLRITDEDKANGIAVANKQDAQLELNKRLPFAACQSQDDSVFAIMFNGLLDIGLGAWSTAAALKPLKLFVGFGLGYITTENRTAYQEISRDATEPYFDANDGRLKFGSVADANSEDANPRLEGKAIPNIGERGRLNHTEADAPDVINRGFTLPLYAGVSYQLEDTLNLPIVAELLYRYIAMAPNGFEESHGLILGFRYQF